MCRYFHYLLQKLNVPIYGTRLTLGFISHKLEEFKIKASLNEIHPGDKIKVGCFKIEALPQQVCDLAPASLLATIANDLAEGGARRGGERWKEELIAKSLARSFAGASLSLTKEGAETLVGELCACRMPYVCPRGKPVMIFTSTRELDRKFDRG